MASRRPKDSLPPLPQYWRGGAQIRQLQEVPHSDRHLQRADFWTILENAIMRPENITDKFSSLQNNSGEKL